MLELIAIQTTQHYRIPCENIKFINNEEIIPFERENMYLDASISKKSQISKILDQVLKSFL